MGMMRDPTLFGFKIRLEQKFHSLEQKPAENIKIMYLPRSSHLRMKSAHYLHATHFYGGYGRKTQIIAMLLLLLCIVVTGFMLLFLPYIFIPKLSHTTYKHTRIRAVQNILHLTPHDSWLCTKSPLQFHFKNPSGLMKWHSRYIYHTYCNWFAFRKKDDEKNCVKTVIYPLNLNATKVFLQTFHCLSTKVPYETFQHQVEKKYADTTNIHFNSAKEAD